MKTAPRTLVFDTPQRSFFERTPQGEAWFLVGNFGLNSSQLTSPATKKN